MLVHLLYDHERASPNRAAGHIHFLLEGAPGTRLTLELTNLDNVWNGQPGSVARELKALVVSTNGRQWTSVATRTVPRDRIQVDLELPGRRLWVARVEPYRISDLDRWLAELGKDKRVRCSRSATPSKDGIWRSSESGMNARRIVSFSALGRIRGSQEGIGLWRAWRRAC